MNIQALPKPNEIWKHKESGELYWIHCVANAEALDPHKWPRQVVYTPLTKGHMFSVHVNNLGYSPIWSRPVNEFLEKLERAPYFNSQWRHKKTGVVFNILSIADAGEKGLLLWLIEPGKEWANQSSMPDPILGEELLLDFVEL